MAFDWTRFLEQHHIEVKASGANVSRDHVAVHCPFCGPADPSMHMSINLSGKGWRCWRHPEHRGKNPTRLVQALIGSTLERAKVIVGQDVFVPTDFMHRVQQQFNPTPAAAAPQIKLPIEFKSFVPALPSGRPFRNYLRRRGFTTEHVGFATRRYGMHYATSGSYKSRIIFVVRYKKEIVAWTGRSIDVRQELRYKALSTDPERAEREGSPVALGAISHFLLWHDRLLNSDADTIVLCEGPMDALKVDILGREYGICATCFFTAEPTEAQIDILHDLCPQFKRRILLLDRGTLAAGIRVSAKLSSLGVEPWQVPAGLKDPGEFTKPTFDKFALALDRGTA